MATIHEMPNPGFPRENPGGEHAQPSLEAYPGCAWSREQALEFYEKAVLSRQIEEEEIRMIRRNECFFQVSSAGHEALGLACGYYLRPAYDWFLCHYRDRALLLSLGMTPREMFLSVIAAGEDPNSAGRQMPCHWSLKRANVFSRSSSIGTQFHHAGGLALGGRYIQEQGLNLPARKDEIIYCSAGDGTICEGEFFEAVNFACLRRQRILFVVEDNGYAISVPTDDAIAGGSVSRLLKGIPGLTIIEVDGSDFFGTFEAVGQAVKGLRSGEYAPVLLHAHVTRPHSHTVSDDQTLYRSRRELEEEQARDVLARYRAHLLSHGVATEAELAEIEKRVQQNVTQIARETLSAPPPAAQEASTHLLSGYSPVTEEPAPPRSGKPVKLGHAIRMTLAEEMERDPRILVFGEDVADASHEEVLKECAGKGGVFKITAGLQTRFGKRRVFNSPLAEAGIIGRAIGLAARGLRPVPEIQFFDFVWPAMTQIRNELATLRYRSAGAFTAPVVVRLPIGGYLRGGGIYHSQSGEGIFAQCSGLLIAYPCNAVDASGLLRTALRSEDPVLFLEPKSLYYQSSAAGPLPPSDYLIPFGKAAVRRAGEHVTIVTWGNLVQKCLEAADLANQQKGLSMEVIDLRTLVPFDFDCIARSVEKTGRLLIASEECPFAGFGAEIAAQVSEKLFDCLDAPIARVGALHSWTPFAHNLAEAVLPSTEGILEKALRLAEY